MHSTYDQVVAVLSETFGVDPGDLRPEATLDDLELDSLAAVEVADVTAEVLGIPVADSTIGKRPLAEIVESLDQQLQQAR